MGLLQQAKSSALRSCPLHRCWTNILENSAIQLLACCVLLAFFALIVLLALLALLYMFVVLLGLALFCFACWARCACWVLLGGCLQCISNPTFKMYGIRCWNLWMCFKIAGALLSPIAPGLGPGLRSKLLISRSRYTVDYVFQLSYTWIPILGLGSAGMHAIYMIYI